MTDARPFVTAYLEAIGATVRPLQTGALAVQWPPTHAAKFGPATTLAFDPAVAEVARAELCVPGSDILDRIEADAASRGFHCVARVDAEGENPPEDVLAANLTFPNASAQLLAAERGVVAYVLFNFRVTLTTDEKAEFLRSILLNAETMQEHTAADVFLQESLTLPEEPNVAASDWAAAYRAACLALERSIQSEVEAIRQKSGALLKEELGRIEGFYDATIKELYESRMQEPLEVERVFRAERERRTEEAKRKYALAARARLVNVRTILIPTTTMRVRVSNARAAKEVGLEFDAVNLETNRPACDACGSPTETAYLCSRGHLACDACDRTCAFCDLVVCATCEPDVLSTCAMCVRAACPDHSFLDEIGRQTYCGDHVHSCAICSRMVGPPYVKPCRLCGQSYCAVCVEGTPGACRTCAALAAVPATHADVTRLTAMKGGPKRISAWYRGQNGRFTVILGTGAVFQHVFVFDRPGNLVHRRKAVRLLT